MKIMYQLIVTMLIYKSDHKGSGDSLVGSILASHEEVPGSIPGGCPTKYQIIIFAEMFARLSPKPRI